MKENICQKSAYCLSCKFPRCEPSCPTKNKIRDFIAAVKAGKDEEAASILYSTNPLPEFTSLLCDHERQCQGHCVRGIKGEPVSIPDIELALAESFPRPYKTGDSNGHKIALIGAGPANISLAFFLLQKGYQVTFFEKEQSVGGAILTGIPEWRYNKAPLDQVQKDLEKLGAEFRFGVEIGKEETLNGLLKEYDRVVLGVGAEKGNSGGMPKLSGICFGLPFLHALNIEKKTLVEHAENPVIWGAGNVAMDCARYAKRLYGKATIVYRRSRKEMPANGIEIEEALQEGIEIKFLTNITSPIIENDKLVGLNLISMELGEPDASGRASFHEIPGSEATIACDLLIPALGEKPAMTSLDPSLENRWDEVEPLPHVYLNGDCRYGAKNIASAVTSGRELVSVIEESFQK